MKTTLNKVVAEAAEAEQPSVMDLVRKAELAAARAPAWPAVQESWDAASLDARAFAYSYH